MQVPKFVKASIISAFATFGIMIAPTTAFALSIDDKSKIASKEVNPNQKDAAHMLEFVPKQGGPSVVQVFTTKEEADSRLNELSESLAHTVDRTTWVRENGQDYVLTRVMVG